MSQLTTMMVESWLAKTDPDGSIHQHIPATVWEEHQLCRAWLALAASEQRAQRAEELLQLSGIVNRDLTEASLELAKRLDAAEKLLREPIDVSDRCSACGHVTHLRIRHESPTPAQPADRVKPVAGEERT